MKRNNHVKSLPELYRQLDLPTDWVRSTKGFTIVNLRDVHLDLPYRSSSFRPEWFSLLFVKDGTGQYTIDEQMFGIASQSVYFTNPSSYRTFTWNEIKDVILVTFDESYLMECVGSNVYAEFPFLLTENVSPKVLNKQQFLELEDLYQHVYREYNGNSDNKHKINGHFLSIILYRIKEFFWEDYNPFYEGNRSSQIVRSFKQFLAKHYRDLRSGKADSILRVADYAEAQNLHPNYLNSVIKAKTGKSVAAWIAGKSIAEAKSLLQNTSINIKEISYRLGFSETAHFSNFFKKQTKQSPVDYRTNSTKK